MIPEQDAGVVLVDKPAGPSSFAMVRATRAIFGIRKVGHAGTLDPFATGLLVVCVGRPATRLSGALMAGEKGYLAHLRLGYVSTTHDPEGEVRPAGDPVDLDEAGIEAVLERFRGPILQTPPRYSALKHRGKPLYHYARRGIAVVKEPREVTVHRLDWLDRQAAFTPSRPTLVLYVRCSKGTYIRSLAHDIGAELGCGAYLTKLRRTESGFFSVDRSVPGDYLFDRDKHAQVRESLVPVTSVLKRLQSS